MADRDQKKTGSGLAFFAICAPGLESITAEEIKNLGVREADVIFGGVGFSGSRQILYKANLHLRTASRILLRLGSFRATKFVELRRKAGHLPWEKYLSPSQPVVMRASCHRSRLIHSQAVEERVLGAMEDRLGGPVQPVTPRSLENSSARLILVRIANDQCTISLDSSGTLLHQRGYRLSTAKAPLRETLAAGMILASGWDGRSPLMDPFCGSGTIAIEAALIARGIPPGSSRRFGFMDWPDFDNALWESLLAESRPPAGSAVPPIVGSDRDRGAVQAALDNARRAGVEDCIAFSRRPISDIKPPGGCGWVVTNPPYGVRLSRSKNLRDLHASFGHVLREKCPGWNVTMLCGNASLQRATGLDFGPAISVTNGGLKVRLVSGRVPE
jgi:putative N6-adenine-specific DNA methylase